MKNLIVKIEKLDHFGRGIAKVNNVPIFVENALIGEEVEVIVTKEKKNYMEGIVNKYIKTSPIRVVSKCPYYDKCGGCDLLHLSYEEQLKYKENKVKEVIKKFSGLECVNSIVGSKQFNYRNKVTLQVNKDIGYFKKRTNDIIAIDKCLLVDDKINKIIAELKNVDVSKINKIVIRVTNLESMVVFYGNITNKINLDVDTIIVNNKVIKGNGYIKENINGLNFIISPTSFFQVNNIGMINIYNKVLDYIDGGNVLDLYCGTGTIGIYVSKKANKVLGIELNKEAVKDALFNKKINNINNIDFISGDVGIILFKNNFKADIVIVDPPRAGLDSNSINNIIKIKPNKIIYVSCDPVTLARDLNILKEHYDVLEITPFDMFSNTYHVECVCLLYLK